MTKDNLSAIEKSKKLRNYVYSKGIWKTYAFVPPSIILFAGLLGFIYLYKNDLLVSWFSIPFIVVFLLGTIWFKATRKYLINEKIKEDVNFLVCPTIAFANEGTKETFLFSIGNYRHNVNYLEKQKQTILDDSNFLKYLKTNDKSQKLTQYLDTDIFICNISLKNKLKENIGESLYVIWINDKKIIFITKKQLLKLKGI